MRGAWFVFGILFWCIGIAVAPVQAGKMRTLTVGGSETFGKARMSGVSLDDEGIVAPGPSVVTLLDDAGAQVWSLAVARDGTVYAGTGSDGGIYRIRGDRGERLAESFEYEVFALLLTPDGRLLASGAPNATIVEAGAQGKLETVFDAPEQVVWSMAPAPGGAIYAVTGERGRIYRIDRDGSAEIVYRSEDAHLMSMAVLGDGRLAVGTGGRGLLLEVDPVKGSSRVLHDSETEEVTRVIASPAGDLFFAVGRSSPGDVKAPLPEAGSQADGNRVTSGGPPSIWSRSADGLIREIWRSPDETIHTLMFDLDGSILAGTGGPAGLYRITPRGEATLLWRPEEGQVLSLAQKEGMTYAGTGNPGRVYRLGPDGQSGGWIRPEPVDAGSPAGWGRAAWEVLPGGGTWTVRTRTGMTEKADSSWSDWSEPLSDPSGSLIPSPPARFIQIEATYRGEEGSRAARLRRIWIPCAEPNLPPRVARIRFSSDEPGTGGERGGEPISFTQEMGGGIRVQIQKNAAPPSTNEPGLPPWVRSVRGIAWDASDPNGDPLQFDVDIRRVGEENLRPLARRLPGPALAIDTATLPDGDYEVRVIARDGEGNPPGEELSDERTGGPFRVDHIAPNFIGVEAGRVGDLAIRIAGRVEDRSSPIRRLEVSWDAGEWKPLVAGDGFFDSPSESFETTIAFDTPEEGNWIALRATDAGGNEGIERIWLPPRTREGR